jgi:hypothetical protein
VPATVPPFGLADCQGRVEQKLREGESFSDVEDYINATSLGPRQKGALWLLAWAHEDPRAQLRVAKEALALVARRRTRNNRGWQ